MTGWSHDQFANIIRLCFHRIQSPQKDSYKHWPTPMGVGQCFAWHVWVLLWIQTSIKWQSDISIIEANLNIIQAHYWSYRAGQWLCFLYSIGKLVMWSPTSHPISCNLICTRTCFYFNNFLSFFYICDGCWSLSTATAMPWQECTLCLFLMYFFVIL